MIADVWKKDVWDFQAKSGSSGPCRLFLRFLGKIAVLKMFGKAPGIPDILLPDIRGLPILFLGYPTIGPLQGCFSSSRVQTLDSLLRPYIREGCAWPACSRWGELSLLASCCAWGHFSPSILPQSAVLRIHGQTGQLTSVSCALVSLSLVLAYSLLLVCLFFICVLSLVLSVVLYFVISSIIYLLFLL